MKRLHLADASRLDSQLQSSKEVDNRCDASCEAQLVHELILCRIRGVPCAASDFVYELAHIFEIAGIRPLSCLSLRAHHDSNGRVVTWSCPGVHNRRTISRSSM
jgi:hypothetical protein